ncbi:MAG: hypothetical protein OEY86_15175 [Nitrospira sp.]|nr:hypothetical protein [Nitrospira sp.]
MLDLEKLRLMTERLERLCDELRAMRRLIDQHPSPEDLRLAVQVTIDTMLQDAEMQDLQIEDLQNRVAEVEKRLESAPAPRASGGATRPGRQG